jgi:hypothetical protein
MLNLVTGSLGIQAPEGIRHVEAIWKKRNAISNLRENGGVNIELKDIKESKEARAALNPR